MGRLCLPRALPRIKLTPRLGEQRRKSVSPNRFLTKFLLFLQHGGVTGNFRIQSGLTGERWIGSSRLDGHWSSHLQIGLVAARGRAGQNYECRGTGGRGGKWNCDLFGGFTVEWQGWRGHQGNEGKLYRCFYLSFLAVNSHQSQISPFNVPFFHSMTGCSHWSGQSPGRLNFAGIILFATCKTPINVIVRFDWLIDSLCHHFLLNQRIDWLIDWLVNCSGDESIGWLIECWFFKPSNRKCCLV